MDTDLTLQRIEAIQAQLFEKRSGVHNVTIHTEGVKAETLAVFQVLDKIKDYVAEAPTDITYQIENAKVASLLLDVIETWLPSIPKITEANG